MEKFTIGFIGHDGGEYEVEWGAVSSEAAKEEVYVYMSDTVSKITDVTEKNCLQFIIPEWSVNWFANTDASALTDEEVDLLESFQIKLLTMYGTAHLHSFEEHEDFGYNEVDHLLGKTYKATLTHE